MSQWRNITLIVVAVEIAVCGSMVAAKLLRHPAAIPIVASDDPLAAREIAALAGLAETGTAADWLSYGQALLGQGLYGYAEAAFRRAVEMAPADADSRFALAFVIDRTGRLAESIREYDACADIVPAAGSPQMQLAVYAIGCNHLRMGDVPAAERAFRANQQFPAAAVQLAKILVSSRRADEAAAILASLRQRVPLSLEVEQLLADVMDALGRPAEAFEAAAREERAESLIPLTFSSSYLAPLVMQRGINGVIERCASMDPATEGRAILATLDAIDGVGGGGDVSYRVPMTAMRVDVALAERRPEEALRLLNVLRDTGHRDGYVLTLEADAVEQQGDRQAAFDLRLRALTMTPTAALHRQLASDYEQRGDGANAAAHRGRALLLQGLAEYRKNRVEEALTLVRQSLGCNDRDAQAWFHAGELEYQLGRQDEADAAFARALEIRPGYGRPRHFLNRPRLER